MTSTSAGNPPEPESIDSTWWSPALDDAEAESYAEFAEFFVSTALRTLRGQEEAVGGPDGLKIKVLDVLASATSPLLVPGNWHQPYTPFMQVDGGRSEVPDDLTPEQVELLERLVPHIDQPFLKARVADIAWTYGNRGRVQLVATAVESYRAAAPLDPEFWGPAGRDRLRRALELSLRMGKTGRATVKAIATDLMTFLMTAEAATGFMMVELSDLLLATGPIERPEARALADHFVTVAGSIVGNPRLGRAMEREAGGWFGRIGEDDLARECQVRVADTYLDEADERSRQGDQAALAANFFLENAIAHLRTLPRAFRAQRGIDDRIRQLRDRHAASRELTLEHMIRVESDPIQIGDYRAWARDRVSGKDPLEALVTLARINPVIDVDVALADARARYSRTLVRIFPASTFSQDGRRVAAQEGSVSGELPDSTVFAMTVREFDMRLKVLVPALIQPALEAVVFEHRLPIAVIVDLCQDSPAIPHGHLYLWARGIWHGLSEDFPSAVSVLIPQLEQMVRRMMKDRGAYTLHVDNGVEMEKGLNALLLMPEAEKFFGPGLLFEMRALFCEQVGPNMRNDLAHGLLNDPQSWSAAAIYAWWFCLRMALSPYFQLFPAAEESGTDV